MTDPTRDLRALPKAHLHIHLEATMRPTTLAELAAEAGVPVPETRDYEGFTGFSLRYGGLMTVLTSAASVARIIDEAVADAAADGVVAIELATTPVRYEHVFGSADAALAAITDAAAAASARYGVWVGVIVAIDRTAGAQHGVGSAELAVRFRERGVVALGLHSEERGYPAVEFTEAFAIARAAGLAAVPHGGELVGPESVRSAIDDLHADRVQHGVRSIEDPALVAELAERGVVLDVCPSSNVILGVVPDLAAHPLPALLAAGVRCSINADDPTLMGPSILDEYALCRASLGLDDATLALCARTSIEASSAPDALKASAGAAIDAWLAA